MGRMQFECGQLVTVVLQCTGKAWLEHNPGRKLRVMVQINSSGEDSKGGLSSQDTQLWQLPSTGNDMNVSTGLTEAKHSTQGQLES
eukprot:6002105-Amphidinium_carterae.1